MKTFLVFLVLFCSSCTSTEMTGTYTLRQFPKTSFEFEDDETFEFIQMYRNPYLHPFDHSDENFFTTSGTWKKDGSMVILKSTLDSMVSKSPESISIINLQTPLDTVVGIDGNNEALSYSRFTFYDIYNDTVNVLYAKSPDGNGMSLLHRSMKFVDWPSQWNDTIEFHFFGYSPFVYIGPGNKRESISMRLFPEHRSQVFDGARLQLRRHQIVLGKAKFRKAD